MSWRTEFPSGLHVQGCSHIVCLVFPVCLLETLQNDMMISGLTMRMDLTEHITWWPCQGGYSMIIK